MLRAELSSIPQLKLPPGKLLPVLTAVHLKGPERSPVVAAIQDLFPGKTAKSTVRGMALPTVTRLHLVRASETAISLAPNGFGVFESGLPPDDYLSIAVRAAGFARYRLPVDMLRDSSFLRGEASGPRTPITEPKARFAAMLKRFPVHPLGWEKYGFTVVDGAGFSLKVAGVKARKLVSAALPEGQLLPLDTARIRILREAWKHGWLATSFDVDRWMIALSTGSNPILQLWRQATRSLDELLIQGRSFGSVTMDAS